MRKLRTQVIFLTTGAIIAGIVATTFVATRTFIMDKSDYVQEINSFAAPEIAQSISRFLENLEQQLAVFDDILLTAQKGGESRALAQSAFEKMPAALAVSVYDPAGLLIDQMTRSPSHPILVEQTSFRAILRRNPGRRFLRLSPAASDGVVFLTHVKSRNYLTRLDPQHFQRFFKQSRAISAQLVNESWEVLFGDQSERGKTLALKKDFLDSISVSGLQSVISREALTNDEVKILAAIAPIPGVEGAAVIVQAPLAQAREMAGQLLEKSAPSILIILSLAILTSLFFSMRLVRPIEEITHAMARVASGQRKIRIQSKSSEEISKLADAFSKMGVELGNRDEEIQRANRELVKAERLAVLGKFSAGIAHEVKNPLNSILGFAQLIEQEVGSRVGEEARKYLGYILAETRRASRIISDLLVFARQKAPSLALSSLCDVLQNASDMLKPQAASQNVDLLLEIQTPEAKAMIDAEQIFQVLSNLVVNGIQAMESAPPGREKKITLRLSARENQVVLEIADTGCGIPDENLPRLFEPFFSTKGIGKGTGLGLSLCHGIIQQHNGKIEVTSVLGEGTTFKILLPRLAPTVRS